MAQPNKQEAGKQPEAPANAPANGNGADKAPVNRFADHFEAVTFQTSISGKEYPNSDGSISRKIAAGICVVKGGFMGISFNVYARKHGKRTTADVSFVGTRNVQAIMPLDERSKAEFTEYKAMLATKFVAWRSQQGTFTPTSKTAVDLSEDLAAGIFEQ